MGAETRDHYPAWEEAREALQDWRSLASATTPQLFPSTHLTTHPRMCIHSLNLPICTPSHLSIHLFPVYLPRQPSAIYLPSFPKHRLSQIFYTFVLPQQSSSRAQRCQLCKQQFSLGSCQRGSCLLGRKQQLSETLEAPQGSRPEKGLPLVREAPPMKTLHCCVPACLVLI